MQKFLNSDRFELTILYGAWIVLITFFMYAGFHIL